MTASWGVGARTDAQTRRSRELLLTNLTPRLVDEDRRNPRRRRPLHPLAAPAFGLALSAPRLDPDGSGILAGLARRALPAQFVDAGADRREIVGSSRSPHRPSLPWIAQ